MRGWIERRETASGERRYHACWREGTQKRRKVFKLKGDAEKHLTTQVVRVAELDDPDLPPRLLGKTWLDAYVADLEYRQSLGDLSPSTVSAYKSHLTTHIRPWLDGRRMDLLSRREVDAWGRALAARVAAKADAEGTLSPRTHNHILGVLSAACAWGVERRWLKTNVATYLRRARSRKVERQVLTAEEQTRLLEAATPPLARFVLTLALYTGLRRGELCGLQWEDLDVARCQLRVRRTIVGKVERRPKTTTSSRSVDVPARLVTLWREARLQGQSRTWVLPAASDSKKALHPDELSKLVGPAFRAIKWTPQLHALRHTYASILIGQGEPAKYVSAQLGHASIQITMDTYGHLFQETRAAAMSRLDARMLGGA